MNDSKTRARIAQEADPIGFLIRLARGEAIPAASSLHGAESTEVYPTLEQRLKAQLILEKRMNEFSDSNVEGPGQVDLARLRDQIEAEIDRRVRRRVHASTLPKPLQQNKKAEKRSRASEKTGKSTDTTESGRT